MKKKYLFRSEISERLAAVGVTPRMIAETLRLTERQARNIFHGKHMTLESAALVARYLNTSIDDVYLATRGAA